MKALDHVINCDFNKSLNPKQAYWVLSFIPEEGFVLPAVQEPHLMASGCAFCLQMPWFKAGRAGKLKCSPRSGGFVSAVLLSVDFGISIIHFLHRFVTGAAGFI